MKVYEIIFSPTGGTLKVADSFTKAFSDEVTQIDLTNPNLDFSNFSFHSDDICIIAVPSYGGRVPAIAISRLQQMKGEQAKTILISVYGNRAYDDTLLELKNTLVDANFHCVAGIAAIAEHSIMHDFAAGRPDADDIKELEHFADKIKNEFKYNSNDKELILPGSFPYRQYNGVPMKPSAGKKCMKCGLCATKCPVNAIPINNPDETDTKKCISCMRCVTICPNKARSVNALLLAAATQKMKNACTEYKHNELFLSI